MRINTGCFLNGCKCFDPDDEDGVGVRADREWQGLTDEERNEIINFIWMPLNKLEADVSMTISRAIEAKLKEKNT